MFDNAQGKMTGSGAADVDGSEHERRHGRRHVTVLRVGKVVREHGDEICVIRNISAGGVMAQLYSPAKLGEKVIIEFKSGRRLAGDIRWVRGQDAGVQFEDEIDIVRFLAGEDDIAGGFGPRAPRLGVGMPAVMRCGVRVHPVTVCDISQGGLKFRAIESTAEGQKLVFRIAGLPPLAGTVRWRDPLYAGISFDTPLALDVLARWAADTDRPR
jgi:hypothetical protein